MSSIYEINKGVNKAIEFRGLKAQYIWFLGIGLAVLLLLFVLLYFASMPAILCLCAVTMLGSFLFWYVYRLSHRYGEHGMMKKMAGRATPKIIKCYSKIK